MTRLPVHPPGEGGHVTAAAEAPAGGELSKRGFLVGCVLVGTLGAALLFPDLGGPGLWEPAELEAGEAAAAASASRPSADGPLSAPMLAGWFLRLLPPSDGREAVVRLPFALSGFVAVLAVLWAGLRLGGRRLAIHAALVLLATPLFLYQGRQVLSHAPSLLAAAATLGAFGPWAIGARRSLGPVTLALGVLGLALGLWLSGILIGVALPALVLGGSVLVGARVSDSARSASRDRTAPGHRRSWLPAAALLGFGLVAIGLALATPHAAGRPSWWLGAPAVVVSEAQQATFEDLVRRLGFGLFPYAPLLLLALVASFEDRSDNDSGSRWAARVDVLLLFATVGGLFVAAIVAQATRQTNLVALVPAVLAIGHWLDRQGRTAEHRPVAAFVVLAVALLLVRDVGQEPAALVSAHLREPIAWPAEMVRPWFAQVVGGIAGLAAVVLTLDPFGPAHPRLARRWRQVRRLAPSALLVAALGGALAHTSHLLPNLSRQLSAKETLDVFRRLAPAGAPLVLFETHRGGAGFEALDLRAAPSLDDLVRALQKPSPSFALIPRARLAVVDRALAQAAVPYCVPVASSSAHLLLATGSPCQTSGRSPLQDLRWRSSDPWPRPAWASATAPALATFGGATELLATDFPQSVSRGDPFALTLVFRVIGTPAPDQDIFVHLQPTRGTIVNGDHPPAGGVFPTAAWRAGDFVRDRHTIALPRVTTPAGRYELYFGFWPGGDTDVRVPVTAGRSDGHNRVPLGQVEIR